MNDYAINKWRYELAKMEEQKKMKKKSPENAMFSGLWRTREDSNLWPSESEAVCQGFSETPDGVYIFQKKPVI